ncbi:hypothetical protein CIRG_08454 [Coccidioides immitis RMSCC 2394]|uniref:Uncharacterized protein n=1 Tax=Coccidioides immitis RMSCC 2394 TaxID=404692 RepID=A0A0J6YP84_COCIT|nr:hypothetical protein CIRG_08454 [Coccidioides immitis RMSCC 2394]
MQDASDGQHINLAGCACLEGRAYKHGAGMYGHMLPLSLRLSQPAGDWAQSLSACMAPAQEEAENNPVGGGDSTNQNPARPGQSQAAEQGGWADWVFAVVG